MTNRGMMKWQPFSAVTPGTILVTEVLKKKNRHEMPVLSDDQITNIENKLLLSYKLQSPIKIKYYKNYGIFLKEGIISKIDISSKKIFINNNSYLYFSQIIEICEKNLQEP